MDFLTAYLAGMVVLMGMFALRQPREDVRIVFLLALAWPLSIVAIVVMAVTMHLGWEIDFANGTKMFGFRKSPNPKVRGYALTVFGIEFQLFTTRKA